MQVRMFVDIKPEPLCANGRQTENIVHSLALRKLNAIEQFRKLLLR